MRAEILGGYDDASQALEIPIFAEPVIAGFPSPAQDYVEATLDLNELCIRHPAATFFVRAKGDSMRNVGIFDGDVLVVDRSLEAQERDIVIACLDGGFTVKRLMLKPKPQLVAENQHYPAIPICEETGIEIFGVVTHVLHGLRQ